MTSLRRVRIADLLAIAFALSFAASAQSLSTTGPHTIVGAWSLNKDLSDPPGTTPERGDRGAGRTAGGRRGGGFGGGGRGGFGRSGVGRSGGGGGNPEEMRRMRDAMRDVLEAPDRMTITETGSMVIITTGDGRTARLATDGSKVKDESTGIERKTRWDKDQLVSELSGAGGGRITQTFAVNPDSRQLTVTLAFGGHNRRPPSRRVYDRLGEEGH